jgi:hypothetical protein
MTPTNNNVKPLRDSTLSPSKISRVSTSMIYSKGNGHLPTSPSISIIRNNASLTKQSLNSLVKMFPTLNPEKVATNNERTQKNLQYNHQWATFSQFLNLLNTSKTSTCTYLQMPLLFSSESLSSLTLSGFVSQIIHSDWKKPMAIHFIWISRMQFLSTWKPSLTAYSQLKSFCTFFLPNKSFQTHGLFWTSSEPSLAGRQYFLTSLLMTKTHFSKSFIWSELFALSESLRSSSP